MPSGLPDWSEVQTALDIDYSNENAELASRLGAAYRYYRSGNVIFQTTFKDDDDYVELIASGATAINAVSTDVALFNNKSLKNSLASTDTSTNVVKRLPYYANSKVGFQFAVNLRAFTSRLHLTLGIIKGGRNVQGVLRLNQIGGTIDYFNSAGAYVQFTAYPSASPLGNHEWYMVKMFVDFNVEHYVGVDLNGVYFDLTAQALYNPAGTFRDQNFVTINMTPPTSGTSLVYLDDFVYTVNDPN